MEEFPEPVANRLRRLRARLGSERDELAPFASIDALASSAAVLVLGAPSGSFDDAVTWFDQLRRHLDSAAAVHVLAPVIEDSDTEAPGLRSRLRRGSTSGYRPRHVIGALREAGWTVADIERFDAEGTTWADIMVRDLGGDADAASA